MNATQRNLKPLIVAMTILAATIAFLLTTKKARYDEYDRLMW